MRSKRIPAGICLLILLSLLLSGCGRKDEVEKALSSTELEFRYEFLNGEESADIILSEGDRLQVRIHNDRGNVDLRIAMTGKDPVYTGSGQKQGDFSVVIPESGEYRVSIRGHEAEGWTSFDVSGN